MVAWTRWIAAHIRRSGARSHHGGMRTLIWSRRGCCTTVSVDASQPPSRVVFRARGMIFLQLLTLPLFLLVTVTMAALLGLPLWPAMLAVAVGAVTCVTLALLPRVVVTPETVTLRGVLNSSVVPVSDVTTVEMLRGRAGRLGKDAWILCVRTAYTHYTFNWVAFFRTDMTTPWTGEAPPPRAERARAGIESAIERARNQSD